MIGASFSAKEVNLDKHLLNNNYQYTIQKVASESVMNASYKSDLTSYETCRQAYFDNLTTNFGKNYKGSCGYVSIGMLLSYYDTYLNDSIVPEQYDIPSRGYDTNIIGRHNSPGSLNENISDPNNNKSNYKYATDMTAQEYYASISALAEHSLHAKLITIGAEHKQYNFSDDKDNKQPCGLNTNYIDTITKDFLSGVSNLCEGTDYKVDFTVGSSTNDDSVRNYIIRKIQSNYPVLIAVTDKNGGGHGCVAYDYDETKDKIYCHMGWGASTTHVTVESQGFTNYVYAMSIDFYLQHNHPENYEVMTVKGNTVSTNKYCICSDDILSIHEHRYFYTSWGSKVHEKSCSCRIFKTENHKYTDKYIMTDNSTHVAYCGCGASTTENHKFNTYQKYNNNYHIVKCECGAQKQAVHKFVTYNVAGHEVTQCPLCGQYKYSQIIIPDLNSLSLEEYLLSLSGEAVTMCGE